MELYAAQELQSTLKAVGGAELPIYRGDLDAGATSVYLQQSELKLRKSGNYPFSVDFVNNTGVTKAVYVAPVPGNPFDVALNPGFSLGRKQAGSVTGSVYVPSSTPDGVYELLLQPTVDGVPADPLKLSIELNRNLLINPGFELSIKDGWYSTTSAPSTDAHSGISALQLKRGTVRTTQSIVLQPGKTYKLSAWMKGSKSGTAQMQVREMVAPSTTKATYAQTVNVTTSWQRYEMTYVQRADTTYEFNWLVFSHTDNAQSLLIDDISLVEVETGADGPSGPPPVVPTGPADDRLRIVLTTTDRLSVTLDVYADYAGYLEGSDGFAVHKSGKKVYIAGDEPRGVLNGVYDFLEENAGVLWTRASGTGTLFEPQSTIALSKTNYAEKSPLKVRGWMTTGSGANGEGHGDYATEVMLARNKNNAKMAEPGNRLLWSRFEATGLTPVMLGHNLSFWLPNDEYFAAHPDYYNMKDGKYVPLSDSTQINFYHPDVPGVIAGRAKDLIARTGAEYIGIGINDNSNFNQGELSEQPFVTEDGVVVQPDDPAYRSTVFFAFLNKVAREVKTAYPDAKVVSYAYTFTDTPPKLELEDNIVIVYAPLYEDARKPINTTDASNPNYAYNEKLKAWAQKTKNIVVYNYYGSFPSSAYERPIAEKVQADMRYYRELGILGVLPETTVDAGNEAWGVNALQYWLFNKLFWNPDEDIEALKAEFIAKAYGAAAEPMARYYDLIEQGWQYDEAQQSWATSGETLVRQYVLVAGIKDAAQQALDEAYALADAQAKERIRPIKETFERMVAIAGDSVNVSANAVKTTYTKQQIMSSLDFAAGPWTKVETPVTYFKDMLSRQLPAVLTKVYLLWDDQYLYVGYENFDPDVTKIIASDTAPNEWWLSGKDDSVETYLSDGTSGSNAYYAFMTNPKALNLDYKGPEQTAAWNGVWESAAEIKSDRWNVIQAIPFSTLNVTPTTDTTIMGLLFRNYHRTGLGLGLYGWAGGSVWNPADFKPIKLVAPQP
ncbi:hypothetical protein DLM86_15915 [Paenibacillus flagellatus]|uniref:CBM-cenC domain-containing protein n=2 Tax=Paenibacillus flagellatus TaxID=2211139 RepID=A0A2V5K492_9BACL|nr:hypothetical protein DLM86_15915 [Paenibacillus flagellatus]